MSSRLPGFHALGVEERLATVVRLAGLTAGEARILREHEGFTAQSADRMVENAIGVFPLPLAVAANFRIDNEDLLIPMVVEEPSVLAGASHAAKLLREGDGIRTTSTDPIMIGQIQVLDLPDLEEPRRRLEAAAGDLVARANACDPMLVRHGGGARRLVVRELGETAAGPMLVLHLEVDVRDAMGANAVNTMAEALAPDVERVSGGRVRLRILSNLADQRLVRAEGQVPLGLLSRPGYPGEEVARGIVEASAMAEVDPYRAATHNKGVMNGIDAFLVAAGQDFRAVEAGCHAFAARDGRYRGLSFWAVQGELLRGTIEIPMQVGTVGGITRTHPVVRVVHKVLGNPDARKLGAIAAACGLAQNLAALMALATEGIQRGHMGMHARNIAIEAGAVGAEIDAVVRELARSRQYDGEAAAAALAGTRRSVEHG